MAYLIKAEDSLFSLICLDRELYKIIAGKEVILVGSKSIISLTVEVRAVDLISQTAVACLVFPFWGKASEQEKILQAIKFQAKVKGFYVNHCGYYIAQGLSNRGSEIKQRQW